MLANNILKNSQKTIYIIDKEDNKLFSYFKNKNINFLAKDKVYLDKYKDNNIVIVSKYNSKLVKDIKSKMSLNIDLDKRDLMLKNIGIYDTNAYRTLFSNPTNKKNKILVIEGRSLDNKDLDTLLNEKQGNFVAVKDGIVVASSAYNPKNATLNNIIKHIKVNPYKGWFIKKNTKAQMLYRNLENKDINYLFNYWDRIKSIVDKNFKNNYSNKQLKVYFREDITNLKDNFIPLKVELLIDLEEQREYKVRDKLCTKYLEDKGLIYVKDIKLKNGWIEFINQTIIYPKLYNDYSYKDSYIKLIKEKTKGKKRICSDEDYLYFAGKMLYLIKNENKKINFIQEIINYKSSINNKQIQKIYSKYVGEKTAKNYMKNFN